MCLYSSLTILRSVLLSPKHGRTHVLPLGTKHSLCRCAFASCFLDEPIRLYKPGSDTTSISCLPEGVSFEMIPLSSSSSLLHVCETFPSSRQSHTSLATNHGSPSRITTRIFQSVFWKSCKELEIVLFIVFCVIKLLMLCRLFCHPEPLWMTTGDSDVESKSPFLFRFVIVLEPKNQAKTFRL